MKKYTEMNHEELLALKKELDKEFEEIKAQGLALDMSRGKPSNAQLELSMEMMDVLKGDSDLKCETGVDCRNYGVIDGIPEAKRLLGEMSEVDPEHIIIYGNSSLNVMFDSIARSMTQGVMGNTPWCKLDKVKFLCPVPGYDRHFKITEFFGIEMINVPMTPQGPDMDMVEKLVSEDAAIKGIWCVPKYSNPQGYTYSKETVERFARLKPAAPDFRIYWDNAYSIHHLYDDNQDFLVEILGECAKAGNPDLVYKFTSTSKVSFPGSGIAAVAASKANLDDFRKYMQVQTIGHDKLNQLRHVRFFKDLDGLHAHMRKHADILRPKFELVLDTLDKELSGLGIGEWTKPHGGYFISKDCCVKLLDVHSHRIQKPGSNTVRLAEHGKEQMLRSCLLTARILCLCHGTFQNLLCSRTVWRLHFNLSYISHFCRSYQLIDQFHQFLAIYLKFLQDSSGSAFCLT